MMLKIDFSPFLAIFLKTKKEKTSIESNTVVFPLRLLGVPSKKKLLNEEENLK